MGGVGIHDWRKLRGQVAAALRQRPATTNQLVEILARSASMHAVRLAVRWLAEDGEIERGGPREPWRPRTR